MPNDYVSDELREHDVAVTVFVRAPGIHYADATSRAREAVRAALRDNAQVVTTFQTLPVLEVPGDPVEQNVMVMAVVELDAALGNHYVDVRPSTRLQHDLRLPELPLVQDDRR